MTKELRILTADRVKRKPLVWWGRASGLMSDSLCTSQISNSPSFYSCEGFTFKVVAQINAFICTWVVHVCAVSIGAAYRALILDD